MALTAADRAQIDSLIAQAEAALVVIKTDVDETFNDAVNAGRAVYNSMKLANAASNIALMVGKEFGETNPT